MTKYKTNDAPYFNKYLNGLFANGDLTEQLKNWLNEFKGPEAQGAIGQTANTIRKDTLKRAIAVLEAVETGNSDKITEAYEKHARSTLK